MWTNAPTRLRTHRHIERDIGYRPREISVSAGSVECEAKEEKMRKK